MKLFTLSILFIVVSLSYPQVQSVDVSINGKFKNPEIPNAKAVSENWKFWCTYEIGDVTDEMRKLLNFKLYNENNFIYSLPELPGSDVEISNSGILVVYDHSEHFKNK